MVQKLKKDAFCRKPSKYDIFCRKILKYVLLAGKMSESALRGDSTLSSSLFRGGQKKCTNHPGKCFWVLPESEHFLGPRGPHGIPPLVRPSVRPLVRKKNLDHIYTGLYAP